MGRKGSGVELREASIRLSFTYEGKQYRFTPREAGRVLDPKLKKDRTYAEALARRIRAEIEAGVFNPAQFVETGSSVRTAGQQMDAWRASLRVAHSTGAAYDSAVRFWMAAICDERDTALGALPLRALRRGHVLFALARRPELSAKTVTNYSNVLAAALQLAVDDKLLAENPAADLPKPQGKKRPPPDPFTRDEAEAIVADMAQHYPAPVANMVEWWFFTGVRTGEMAGLQWPSVGLAEGVVRVHETIARGRAKDSTKTGHERDVLLTSRAAAALQRQKAHTLLAGAHVWADPRDGQPFTRESTFCERYWKPTLRRLGLRYRRPYNCRHTYATMMLMAGRTPAWCARQLGHSVQMFLQTYARWLEGDQDARELDGLERWLNEGGEGRIQGKNRG